MMLRSNFPFQRVFIVGAGSMFEEGILCLLTFDSDLQVSGSGYNDDASFLSDITQLQPDVILLNESTPLNPARLLELLSSIPKNAGRRVIIVRLNNNIIDVYDFPYRALLRKLHKRWQFIITKREDLIDIIHGDFTKQVELQISNQSPI